MNGSIEILKQYGLGVFLSISILGIAWYLLKKTFENHSKEREGWMKMVDNHFVSQNKAHEYQRDEHIKIMNGLNGITTNLAKLNGK